MVDDEAYIRRSIDLARRAAERGDTPFGSLLVRDDEVLRTDRNTTITDDDITAHPELKLARWAARELAPEARAETTMYTSTEPCAMCAAAIHYAGLGRVVFSVPGSTLADVRGEAGIDIPCAEVIERAGGATEVVGEVLEPEGRELHEAFYG